MICQCGFDRGWSFGSRRSITWSVCWPERLSGDLDRGLEGKIIGGRTVAAAADFDTGGLIQSHIYIYIFIELFL